MKRRFVFMICICFLLSPVYVQGDDVPYGDRLAAIPNDLSRVLAELHLPDEYGAMGRNRPRYFHVRFQMGLHHLAHHAIAAEDVRALRYFVSAIEYALAHQKEDGDFQLSVPPGLPSSGQPSLADRVSGVAFFASSAGSGIYALETSAWIRKSVRLKPLINRIAAVRAKLDRTLNFLTENSAVLETADRDAPNRLLFDAMAFYTLSKVLDDPSPYYVAERFLKLATDQIHQEGYFIEAGGYDSSYNGVSTALAYRLVLMGASDALLPIAQRAIKWQVSRIACTGEILTDGNTRVHPNGEKFLGRKKEVDVGHTLEALMLSALLNGNEEHLRIAGRVYDYYRNKIYS